MLEFRKYSLRMSSLNEDPFREAETKVVESRQRKTSSTSRFEIEKVSEGTLGGDKTATSSHIAMIDDSGDDVPKKVLL